MIRVSASPVSSRLYSGRRREAGKDVSGALFHAPLVLIRVRLARAMLGRQSAARTLLMHRKRAILVRNGQPPWAIVLFVSRVLRRRAEGSAHRHA